MDVYHDSEGHLVLQEPPLGAGCAWFALLGGLGCGAPFALAGLVFVYRSLGSLFGRGSFEGLGLLVGLMCLVMGGAILAAAHFHYLDSRTSRRTTFKESEVVVAQVVSGNGKPLKTHTHRLAESSRLVCTSLQVRVGTGGSSRSETFYSGLVRTPDCSDLEVESRTRPAEVLLRMLRAAHHLRLPVLVDWPTPVLRPEPSEGLFSQESADAYIVSEDGKKLTLELEGKVRRVSQEALYFLALLGGASFVLLFWGWAEGRTAHLYLGALFGLLGLGALALIAVESSRSVRVTVAQGLFGWYENGKRIHETPLHGLWEMGIADDGLHLFFSDRVLTLLSGIEGREERAFLFRLIEAAWKANGLPGFEGAFGSRVLPR